MVQTPHIPPAKTPQSTDPPDAPAGRLSDFARDVQQPDGPFETLEKIVRGLSS